MNNNIGFIIANFSNIETKYTCLIGVLYYTKIDKKYFTIYFEIFPKGNLLMLQYISVTILVFHYKYLQ